MTPKRHPAPHLRELLGSHYEIKPFRELSVPFRLAIAHYMAVDGEAWEFTPPKARECTPPKLVQALRRDLPKITRTYGATPFGRVMLSAKALCRALEASEIFQELGHKSVADYYQARKDQIVQHPRTKRWPVILADDAEVLQDGWHRVGCYLHRGDALIPAVFYPRLG